MIRSGMPVEMSQELSNVLDFMSLRPPRAMDEATDQLHYIRDMSLHGDGLDIRLLPTELLSDSSPSDIGRIVFKSVIGGQRDVTTADLVQLVPRVEWCRGSRPPSRQTLSGPAAC